MATEADRLHLLHDFTRQLTTATDLDSLLREATRCAREVFASEGCALLLLDESSSEFTFPISSQRESGPVSAEQLAEIRFPLDQGIAGWVLANDEPAMVADVANDPRFYASVDQLTNMTTRSVLCAPLRTRTGNVGVIEVVNPSAQTLAPADLEFLETLASDIAMAYEKALLYEQLRGEVLNLRRLCSVSGLGLALAGTVIVGVAALNHLARALPASELLLRPGVLAGLATVAVGAVLIAGARLPRRRPS
jgi:GAF domain-containing protein